MARNRASMREGPLAELFRATEAAQRRAEAGGKDEPSKEHANGKVQEPPAAPAAPSTPAPEAPRAREPEPERERPGARWLEPLPDHPARLERGRGNDSYL